MRELTEREEQEMIDRAKAGDPQANYEMSLWALERAKEEPGEVRWNKLAAKCLVKSAQAGYGPAQKRMDTLLLQQKQQEQAAAEPEPEPVEEEEPPARPVRRTAEPVRSQQTRQAASRRDTSAAERPVRRTASGTRRPAVQSAAETRRPARQRPVREPEEEDFRDDIIDEEDRPLRSGRSRGRDRGETREGRGGLFANWGDAQWRTMEIICIAICVVLAIVLAVMLLTGNRKDKSGGSGDGYVPAANVAGDTSGQSALPAAYPDEATKMAISSAQLSQYPEEGDYVSAPTTATVSVTDTLRLRSGPNTTFDEVDRMPTGTQVEIFAKRSGWDLIRYNSSVWGWCSAEYLIEDAPATAPAADPNAAG